MRKTTLLTISIVVFTLIFFTLSYRNPFSAQSSLANLEPYPDTLYYGYPAWSLVHGDGFAMKYGSIATKIIVPPVYSIYLAPFFLIANDVRVFYLANMALALASLVLFLKVLHTIFGESGGLKYILFFSGLLYTTTFYVFTLPSLLMAENITLFFVSLGLYLFVSPGKRYTSALIGCAMALLVLIKFSNFPIILAFSTLFLIKAFHKNKRDGIKLFAWLAAGATVVVVYVISSKILVGHKNLQGAETISLHNFVPNFTHYLSLFVGSQTSFLWFTERLISPLTLVLSIGGMIVGLATAKWRNLTLSMLILLMSTLVAISFFAKVDGRYIIALLPALIIFVGILIHVLTKLVVQRKEMMLAVVVILTAFAYLAYPGFGYVRGEPIAISLKKQIGLNFKHKADPWNYHAVQNLNSYFNKHTDVKPYVGTVLPPFYVAFYANGNFQYLPLTLSQEFISMDDVYRKNVMKIGTMVEYYNNLLSAGNEVYVTNIYLGNVRSWGDEFSSLSTYFNLKLVKEGCLGSCNIYKIENM